jgi:hypothetical protein
MIVSFTFIIVVEYSIYYTIYKYFWPVAMHGHDPGTPKELKVVWPDNARVQGEEGKLNRTSFLHVHL